MQSLKIYRICLKLGETGCCIDLSLQGNMIIEYPLKFIKKSLQEKCFVALNTIENTLSEDLSSSKKDSFIFIGSLDKRKGLRETIISFHKYL